MADQDTCQQIICGAITQAQAGIPLLLDCAQSGYVGAQPCNSDVCQPWLSEIEANMGGTCPGSAQTEQYVPTVMDIPNPTPDYVIVNKPPPPVDAPPGTLTPRTLLTPLPSITQPHNLPTMNPAGQNGVDWWCVANQYVSDNPMIAAGIVAAVYLLMRNKK